MPAARPCNVRRTGRPAAAVPVLASLARTGTRYAARPFRSGSPWVPGCAWRRGRSRTTCGIRSCPAVRARPAPSLGRAVRPGPRPEPGIGSRAEPGLLAATSPRICSRTRPPAAWPGTRIRPGSGTGSRAETRIGVTGPPHARGVLRSLGAKRRRERDAWCRPVARCQAVAWCPRPARTRFRSTASPGTRPAARVRARTRAQAVTRSPARIGAGIPARAGDKTGINARAGSRYGRPSRARIQARIAGWAQPWVIGAQAAVATRVWARAEVTMPGLLIPNVRIGCAAVQGRILIGAGGGQSPARVPRGFRTAVAHAPLSSPRTPRRCRRDLLEVTPS
jgi:hypothetical protein